MPNLLNQHLAAVDLGSNSFRMLIGRAQDSAAGVQVYAIDSLREPVRLAAGLDDKKYLSEAAQQIALQTLQRFGERLRQFHPDRVRAVATNTVRVAKNAPQFLQRAQAALGFPIEVIAGREEARLVYIGAAHSVSVVQGKRLVVDIGGGSTEFIIGQCYEPGMMESLYIGCVSMSQRFFPGNQVDETTMRAAEIAARKEIQIIAADFKRNGWNHAVGSSGTARALADMIGGSGFNPPDQPGDITLQGLRELRRTFVRAGNLNKLRMEGLKPDRVPVAAGGLAIMLGVFEELGIQSMEVTDAALRLGVLYDLLGREQSQDMREVTALQFTQRYGADAQQARRVSELALRLYAQLRPNATEADQRLLRWAAQLHEIGLSISHSAYHKHSAYIAANADMPGFSRGEQAALAQLVLTHTGKLKKLSATDLENIDLDAVLALRLAVILARNRTTVDIDGLHLRYQPAGVKLSGLRPPLDIVAPEPWLKGNPLTEYSLRQEAAEWTRLNWNVALQSPS